jgi:hypothetical protein
MRTTQARQVRMLTETVILEEINNGMEIGSMVGKDSVVEIISRMNRGSGEDIDNGTEIDSGAESNNRKVIDN